MAKRKVSLPGSYGGLFTISDVHTEGLKIKPKELIILTVVFSLIIWVLNLLL